LKVPDYILIKREFMYKLKQKKKKSYKTKIGLEAIVPSQRHRGVFETKS
jgi:hypothetical protein